MWRTESQRSREGGDDLEDKRKDSQPSQSRQKQGCKFNLKYQDVLHLKEKKKIKCAVWTEKLICSRFHWTGWMTIGATPKTTGAACCFCSATEAEDTHHSGRRRCVTWCNKELFAKDVAFGPVEQTERDRRVGFGDSSFNTVDFQRPVEVGSPRRPSSNGSDRIYQRFQHINEANGSLCTVLTH